MFSCLHCGKPVHWDAYWDSWVHSEPGHTEHPAETAFWTA